MAFTYYEQISFNIESISSISYNREKGQIEHSNYDYEYYYDLDYNDSIIMISLVNGYCTAYIEIHAQSKCVSDSWINEFH